VLAGFSSVAIGTVSTKTVSVIAIMARPEKFGVAIVELAFIATGCVFVNATTMDTGKRLSHIGECGRKTNTTNQTAGHGPASIVDLDVTFIVVAFTIDGQALGGYPSEGIGS